MLPPPPIDYAGFTAAEFVEALTRLLRERSGDPAGACEVFLGFCDPILQKQPASFFRALLQSHRSALYRQLKRIPRPYRELMAVYQAWGMVSSDGFKSYVQMTSPEFDKEVDRGVALLGRPEVSGVMAEARSAFQRNNGVITKAIDEDLWRRLYDAMPDFEARILGPELLRGAEHG